MRKLYIGRLLPKRFKELPGAMHLGRGIWIIPYEVREIHDEKENTATLPEVRQQ